MTTLLRLASSQPRVPVRACVTCEFRGGRRDGYDYCKAVAMHCDIARLHACREGKLWTPRQPRFWTRLGNAIIAAVGRIATKVTERE